MKHLTPEEIRKLPPEDLGQGGFCFLVAKILLEQFPDAIVYRLTDQTGKAYSHVFLSVQGDCMDIGGRRDVVAAMRFRCNDPSLIPEPVDRQKVWQFFDPRFSPEQLAAAGEVLRAYIESHCDIFIPQPSVGEGNRQHASSGTVGLMPDARDLEMAREFMAEPEKLKIVLGKIAAVTGRTVPVDADEKTVALAITAFRKAIALVSGP